MYAQGFLHYNKPIMEDKYNRLGPKVNVISVVNFCIGLSAVKSLFQALPVIEDLPICAFRFHGTIPTIFCIIPLHNLMVNNLI